MVVVHIQYTHVQYICVHVRRAQTAVCWLWFQNDSCQSLVSVDGGGGRFTHPL